MVFGKFGPTPNSLHYIPKQLGINKYLGNCFQQKKKIWEIAFSKKKKTWEITG